MSARSRRTAALIALVACGALAFASPAAGKRPNLLVVVTDDQRARGTLAVMDATTKWLVRGGTSFDAAYATTPLCCPSRVSIFTGDYAHNHGVFLNNDPNKIDPAKTIQRHLSRAGYATGLFGKYLLNEPLADDPPFWDSFAVTLGQYYGGPWNVDGEVKRVPGYSTKFIGRRARGFIRELDRDRDRRPWFLYVATGAPHGPAKPEEKYRRADVGELTANPARTEKDLSDKPAFWQELVARFSPEPGFEQGARIREQQLRTLLSVDDMVAGLRRELVRRDELEDTLVLFTSDNGLLWGEHGGLTIKDMPWPESSRVPMLLSWPGLVEAGDRDRRLVANIDIAPTLLDAAGLAAARRMDGRSLLRSHERRELLLEYGGLDERIAAWRAIATPRYQYVEYDAVGEHSAEIAYYDLVEDPFILENGAIDAGSPGDPRLQKLSRRLGRYAGCAGHSCP